MTWRCRYCDKTWRDLLAHEYMSHVLLYHEKEWSMIWEQIKPSRD